MNPKNKLFKFGGQDSVPDTSQDAISDPLEVCFNYSWSLIPRLDSIDGSPLYSIEAADDINAPEPWPAYEERTENAAIDQPFADQILPFRFLRIRYTAADNTTGTIQFPLELKL